VHKLGLCTRLLETAGHIEEVWVPSEREAEVDDFPFFQDCLGVVDVPRPVIEMAPRPPWTGLKPVARMRVLKAMEGGFREEI
jgi:hypothetical protein